MDDALPSVTALSLATLLGIIVDSTAVKSRAFLTGPRSSLMSSAF